MSEQWSQWLEFQRKQQREAYLKRKELGLCIVLTCNKPKSKTSVRCKRHAEKAFIKQRERYKRQKQDKKGKRIT